MSFHSAEIGPSIHVVHAFTYANAAARTSAAGLQSADIGKVALQSDNNSYWILQNNSPVTWSQINGGGTGGSSGINYLDGNSSDFEGSVGNWVAYSNAAQATPVTGIGGSPSVTIAASTSSPLVGATSGLLTKDAANRQGQGISCPFTIDSGYEAKVFGISFLYNVSANFAASSGQLGSESDIEVWIYDITNSQLIPVAPFKLLTAAGSTGKFTGSFQTNSNSTSYRLILHVPTTNALAWTMKIDSVVVGPQTTVLGAPVTDWVSTPFTGSWVSNTTYTGYTRRVGDSLEGDVKIQVSGAPTSVGLTVNVPFGLTIDTAKLGQSVFGNRPQYGTGTMVVGSSPVQYGSMAIGESSTQIAVFWFQDGAASYAGVTQVLPTTWANGNWVQLHFSIPIVGWGSTMVLSQDTDTRVVAAKAYGSTTSITTGSTINIINPTKEYDTHSSYSTSTGLYTCPVSGYYRVVGSFTAGSPTGHTIADTIGLRLIKNGSFVNAMGAFTVQETSTSLTKILSGSTTIFCTAGDTLNLAINNPSSTFTGNGVSTDCWVTFERLSGPAQIATTETVGFSAVDSVGNSIGTSFTDYNFATKEYDTHGTYNNSTGVYTIPISGKYAFTGSLRTTGVGLSNGQNFQTVILVNAVIVASNIVYGNGGTNGFQVVTAKVLNLKAGDQVKLQALSAIATSGAAGAAAPNYFQATRIGN